MASLLADEITGAAATATPLDAVAVALEALALTVFTPARRPFVARRRQVIAANRELREREALKGLDLATSMAAALERRGAPHLTAGVAAQLGALALKLAYERWSETTGEDDFAEIARQTLSEVRAAAAAC